MIPTVQDPAVAGLRRQVAEMRDQRDAAVREATESRELLEHADRQRTRIEADLAQARRELQTLQPLADSWHRIADLVDQCEEDGWDPYELFLQVKEQVGER